MRGHRHSVFGSLWGKRTGAQILSCVLGSGRAVARLSLLSGTSGATASLLPHPDVLDLTLENAEEQDRWHFINSAQTPAYLLHSFILQESSTCQMSCLSLGKEWGKHFSLVPFPCVTCVSVAEMRKATHRHRHTELCGMMGQRERHSTLYSAVVSMGKESEKEFR